MHKISLSHSLKHHKKQSEEAKENAQKNIPELQKKMLLAQQGLYHQKERAIIMFEGFDAAGKGGAIRSITEMLDPRSFQVHAIAAPTPEEQSKHWLYRFWMGLPKAGHIAIFDRSWYGRVLVEKIEQLIPEKRVEAAYQEINQFEKMLTDDGITLIKIFISITKDEQLERFEDRLKDPYKQWKITPDDIRNRKKWDEYVHSMDVIFKKTHTKENPWHLVQGNSKNFAREQILSLVTDELSHYVKWMKKNSHELDAKELKHELKKIH